MIKEKLLKILSINGIALTIGILGSIASIFSVFVTKWDVKVDFRWFIFTLFVFLSILLILIKLINDLKIEIDIKRHNKASAIRYISQSQTFLFEKNDFLGYSAMVSIFYLDDACEVEFGKGYVTNIQNEFVHIKLLEVSENFSTNYPAVLTSIENNDNNSIQKVIVKSYITYTN